MYVIGTAGHVDHGKSTLVRALTGIDPDRLPEEKLREMTIDLGFAWLELPSGREVSIVDVPGHERFIRNMLAGVGGIDLVLFVVAANEGVMPQTTEHLAILDLLRIKQGIIAITKKELVDDEWMELVVLDLKKAVEGTILSQAPVIPVSAMTGEGLTELVATMDDLLESLPPKRDIGRPRLIIDRVFTIAGRGTVVTGTLIDGRLSTGEEVEIVPLGLQTRLRGLQVHKQEVTAALPGDRVGANLGNVHTSQLQRGFVVTTPGWLVPTTSIDAELRLLSGPSHPLKHGVVVTLHIGASEVATRIRLLANERLKPGEIGWAQLSSSEPIATVKGDLFVIRSLGETLGGGEVVDAHAKPHRRFQSSIISNLEIRKGGTVQDVILATLELNQTTSMGSLPVLCNLSSAEVATVIRDLASRGKLIVLGDSGPQPSVISAQGWDKLTQELERIVKKHHREFPLRRGIHKAELQSKLKIPAGLFTDLISRLSSQGVLLDGGDTVSLASHATLLNADQQRAVKVFVEQLIRSPFSAPETSLAPELLDWLIGQKQVVKLDDSILLANQTYEHILESIVEYIKGHGEITVAEVRDFLKTSRKYALALMEYLDGQKITRRVGDKRVLRQA